MYNRIAIVLLCLFSFGTAFSQNTDDRKFKLAQSYEQSGDFQNAARLYQELYAADKRTEVYFQGVRRSLMALNQFAPLIPLVEEQLKMREKPELYTLLGDLLWKTGKANEADNAWKKALALAPNRETTYAMVAQAQIDNRLFDKAIATFLQGRKASGNETLFANELSQLYGAVGNFTDGTKEVITNLLASGNLALAQGRISAYLISEKGVTDTRAFIEKVAKSESHSIIIQQLYAWFLREIKDYNRAFEVYETIDELAGAHGREILNFGDLARQEQAYEPAIKAYSVIIAKGKENPYSIAALFGYARTIELRSRTGEKIPEEEVEKIIKLYRKIIEDFPATRFAAESQYHIAALIHEHLDQPKRAMEEYRKLLEQYKSDQIAARGGVELGELYIQSDDLEKAERTFQMVATTYQRYTNETDEANYYLAQINYYRGNLDSAKEQFGRLSVNSNADITNDALTMIAFLEDNKDENAVAAVKEFARAELREHQKKYADAIESFKKAASLAPGIPLAEQTYIRIGTIQMNQHQYSAARETFNALLAKNPDTMYGDAAMFNIGDSYAAEKNKDEAIKWYTQILEKYPRSALLKDARTKIRKLRGDA